MLTLPAAKLRSASPFTALIVFALTAITGAAVSYWGVSTALATPTQLGALDRVWLILIPFSGIAAYIGCVGLLGSLDSILGCASTRAQSAWRAVYNSYWLSRLSHKSHIARRYAATALGQPGFTFAVSALRSLLDDSQCRAAAHNALANIGGREVMLPLAEGFIKFDDGKWSTVESRLARVDASWKNSEEIKTIVPQLAKAIGDHKNKGPRLAELLGVIGDPQAIPGLVEAIQRDSSTDVVKPCLSVLKQFTSPQVLPTIVGALRESRNPGTRRAAAAILSDYDEPQVVDALIAALSDENLRVVSTVVSSLTKLRNPKAIAPLVLRASEENDSRSLETFSQAMEALDPNWRSREDLTPLLPDLLANIPEGSTEFILGLLNTIPGDWSHLPAADEVVKDLISKPLKAEHAPLLAATGNPLAIPPLIELWSQVTGEELQAVETALNQIDERWASSEAAKQLVPMLAERLADGYAPRALSAIHAIQRLGYREFIPSLLRALTHRKEEIRTAARETLDTLDDKWPQTPEAQTAATQWLIPALNDVYVDVHYILDILDSISSNWTAKAEATELVETIISSELRLRHSAVLTAIRDQRAIPRLLERMCRAEEEEIVQIEAALDAIAPDWANHDETKSATATFAVLVKSAMGSPNVAVSAARLMERLGHREFIGPLVVGLTHESDEVKSAATQALETIDADWVASHEAKSAVPELREVKSSGLFERIQESAQDVLTRLGYPSED